MAVSDWVRAVLQRGPVTHSRGGLGGEVPRISVSPGQTRGRTEGTRRPGVSVRVSRETTDRVRIDTEKGMYSEGLVHALVEAEKPHRLPVRAGGPGEQVARVPPGDPQARGPGAGLWEGRGARASQLSREGARTLPAPLCSIWASADWKGPTHSGGGGGEGGWIFFTQSADSNANLSCPPTHTQTPDMSFSPATWASP